MEKKLDIKCGDIVKFRTYISGAENYGVVKRVMKVMESNLSNSKKNSYIYSIDGFNKNVIGVEGITVDRILGVYKEV